jgi:hypothetical protein
MLANSHGQFRSVVSGLDRPTTFEIIGDTAFVVTITGKVLRTRYDLLEANQPIERLLAEYDDDPTAIFKG